jgi:hypothetical protein
MIDLVQHWEFILTAYAGCFGLVAVLIGWTVFDAHRSRVRVMQLDAVRGAQRGTKPV